MISENGYPNFSNYLNKLFKEIIISGIGDKYNDIKMKVSLEYIVSGLVGVICMWIIDYDNLLMEEVIEKLSEIHFHNIYDLLK